MDRESLIVPGWFPAGRFGARLGQGGSARLSGTANGQINRQSRARR
jgi:hypothetical protein